MSGLSHGAQMPLKCVLHAWSEVLGLGWMWGQGQDLLRQWAMLFAVGLTRREGWMWGQGQDQARHWAIVFAMSWNPWSVKCGP